MPELSLEHLPGFPLGQGALSYDAFVLQATGHDPYDYQRRIAAEGLPELLRIPTGAGKTMAVALGWLYRRRLHPDPAVRASTPHWLAFVLPMRVLVEQTAGAVEGWLTATGLKDDVGLHVVMGGEGRHDSLWRTTPERDAIFVGTLDMLLSRALNRGYGESRFAWPIDFGLFNAGVQWVFDEVQLMGPALPTSRQLEAFRRAMGTAMPCRSTWMSATVEEASLSTVDRPQVEQLMELGSADRTGPLARRLDASKLVRRLGAEAEAKTYPRSLATGLREAHQPGTLTIAVLNTVARARELFVELRKADVPDLVLLHSRFRPADRWKHLSRALGSVDPAGPGRIVVSTQIIEAGVDISATTLFTEAAPWPSIVQRAGRCNRDGEAAAAALLWAVPPRPEPYQEPDVACSVAALGELDGRSVTPEDLGSRPVEVKRVVHPVLRRRDLVGVFDTAPDLSGNDVDIGRFIRDADDLDVQVAWRSLPPHGPVADEPVPTRTELCPVPIGDLRKELQSQRMRYAWRFDHLAESWVACGSRDLRPGMVLLLDASAGGYAPETGWDPGSRTLVEPIATEEPSVVTAPEEGVGADPATAVPGRWVSLRQHLEDVGTAVREIATGVDTPGLTPAQIEAAVVAGGLHDWGKVHPVFQATLARSARTPEEQRYAEEGGPWAKSPRLGPHHRRKHFRHELASALALDQLRAEVLAGSGEADLVTYLVGAHHGRVRLSIRSLPDESEGAGDRRVALGIWDGDKLPAVETHAGTLPAVALDLSVMELGDGVDGRASWTCRALALRDRTDLGPFRLGFLEALVRLADWRASAREGL
jgi:CRISPR-associated endonuclease/helicase Cas3